MSLLSSSRGLWLFDRTLVDEVQNNDFIISSGTAEYQAFQKFDLPSNSTETKYGLVFRDGITFTSSTTGVAQLSSGGQFSFAISFWWYSPGAVGYVRNARTRNNTSKVAPILGIGTSGIYGDNLDREYISVGEILICEVAASATQNAIRYEVCQDNSNPTHRFESSAYSPGLRHVFISHHTESGVSVVRMFIDGKMEQEFVGPAQNINTPTSSPVRLNSLYHGPTAHKVTQDGAYISELVIRGDASSGIDSNEAGSVFKFGWETLLDSDTSAYQYDYFGVSYEQPSTITTNQIYSEGGSIYVARSNGEIMRGESPIWDNSFNYTTEGSLRHITIRDSTKASRLTTGLQLTGTTVRI